jgi:diaminohydroxyphosphoribosylaminopyrimidine deaminase/5-amino-6-(5-phosphoribosylamino)uracil reductase
MSPEAAMRLALAEARRARGRTFPNPPVGAVVFRGGEVLGSGHTRPAGGPHAEVVALDRARRRHGPRRLRGASLAVTLEPCAHQGRTGPCADLVARSGVRRVYVGHADPHPEVAGQGLRRLRRAGLEVRVGVLEAACREQHRGFLSVLTRGRPFVMLKLATSLDGRIATRGGESRWITGEQARARAHGLRARVDAVAVGAGTALADDPELTARAGGRVTHRPVRVLLDSRLRVPRRSRLYRSEIAPTWVLCSRAAPAGRRREALAAGARVLPVPARRGARTDGQLDLRRALALLARAGLTEVLVEGGGELAAALLREGLVDELHWFAAPVLLGGDARPAVGPLGLAALAQAVGIDDLRVRRVGRDLHLWGRPRSAGARLRRGTRAAP